MDIQEFDDLRRTLPSGRTLYTYYKDRYSLQLLRYAVRTPTPFSRLRQHPVARLLEKPRVKQMIARCGQRLTPADIENHDGDPQAQAYHLSVGCWGAAPREQEQMSRRGVNLVLQLNFSQEHCRTARHLLGIDGDTDPFNGRAHPVLKDARPDRRYTLAWSRVDIDPGAREALIEEIQSDWVRDVHWIRTWAERRGGLPECVQKRRGINASADNIVAYDEIALAPHRSQWAEAMLSATLYFLREELGVERIWMHTPTSSEHFKRMHNRSQPPRSLYTDLPRRFCFEPTSSLPGFVAEDRKLQRVIRRRPAAALQTLNF